MVISWDASIGYGRITIFKEDDKWIADTECMCIDEDKDFLKMVLEKWIEDIKIVG